MAAMQLLAPHGLSESDLDALAALDRHAVDSRLRSLGIAKIGQRCRIALALQSRITPSSTPQIAGLRVAVVCNSSYFAGTSYGGAVRASLALLREIRRICGSGSGSGTLEIFALLPKPVPAALAFKLGPGRVGVLEWGEEQVWVGKPDDLLRLSGSARAYHAVISLSIEPPMVGFAASLHGERHWALAHNYYLPPFGPFRRFEAQPGHAEALCALDALLCPCEHLAAYMRRWGPERLCTQPLYAADYHYLHSGGGGGGGELALPAAMRPWEPQHRFVTMVSPCPEKGLCILLTLARRMPHLAFAAVATQWTDPSCRARLSTLVTLLEPHEDIEVILRQTRVLLAPSLWQECCPLVVMEALVRGIPCVSSDACGLPEANRNAHLVAPTSLSYDFTRGTPRHPRTQPSPSPSFLHSPLNFHPHPNPSQITTITTPPPPAPRPTLSRSAAPRPQQRTARARAGCRAAALLRGRAHRRRAHCGRRGGDGGRGGSLRGALAVAARRRGRRE